MAKRSYIKDLTHEFARLSGSELSREPRKVTVEARVEAVEVQGEYTLLRISDGPSPFNSMTARLGPRTLGASVVTQLVGETVSLVGKLSKPLMLTRPSPSNLVLIVESIHILEHH